MSSVLADCLASLLRLPPVACTEETARDVVQVLRTMQPLARKNRKAAGEMWIPSLMQHCACWASLLQGELLRMDGDAAAASEKALKAQPHGLVVVHLLWDILRNLCASAEAQQQMLLVERKGDMKHACFDCLQALVHCTRVIGERDAAVLEKEWMSVALATVCSGLKLCINFMAGNPETRLVVWHALSSCDLVLHPDDYVFALGCAVIYNATIPSSSSSSSTTSKQQQQDQAQEDQQEDEQKEDEDDVSLLLYEMVDRESSLSMDLVFAELGSPVMFGLEQKSATEQDVSAERDSKIVVPESSSESLEWVELFVIRMVTTPPSTTTTTAATTTGFTEPAAAHVLHVARQRCPDLTALTIWSHPAVMMFLVCLQRALHTDVDLKQERVREALVGNVRSLVTALCEGVEEAKRNENHNNEAWLRACMMVFGVVGTAGIASENDNGWLQHMEEKNSSLVSLALRSLEMCEDEMYYPQTGSDNHASDVNAQKPTNVYHSPRGFRTAVMRLICTTSFRHAFFQSQWGQRGGLIACMNHTRIDENNPYVREWAIFAIKNLTEDHIENSRIVHELRDPKAVQSNAELKTMGMEATLNHETGKIKIKSSSS